MGEAMDDPEYSLTLIERRMVAEGTMAFHFDKPPGFVFTPGQFVDLTLTEPSETDAAGNTRAFSIASAPQEPTLMVATRLRDTAYKRELQRMPIGKGRSVNWCCMPIWLDRPSFWPVGSASPPFAAC